MAPRLLNPRMVIRRMPRDRGPEFPPSTVLLFRGDTIIARILFRPSQERIAVTDVAGLSGELSRGLPPGEYRLRLEGESAVTQFVVTEAGRKDVVVHRLEALVALLGNRTESLYIDLATEHLLGQQDDRGNHPYLTDVLEVLESVPDEALTPYLRQIRQIVLRRLGLAAADTPFPDHDGEATGIESIDRARSFLAEGRWNDAMKILRTLPSDPSSRTDRAMALALLYRAVLSAEAGLETEEPVDRLFQQARCAAGRRSSRRSLSGASRIRVLPVEPGRGTAVSMCIRNGRRSGPSSLDLPPGSVRGPHAIRGRPRARGAIRAETASHGRCQPRAIVCRPGRSPPHAGLGRDGAASIPGREPGRFADGARVLA